MAAILYGADAANKGWITTWKLFYTAGSFLPVSKAASAKSGENNGGLCGCRA
jgi:hypothetical protein